MPDDFKMNKNGFIIILQAEKKILKSLTVCF